MGTSQASRLFFSRGRGPVYLHVYGNLESFYGEPCYLQGICDWSHPSNMVVAQERMTQHTCMSRSEFAASDTLSP